MDFWKADVSLLHLGLCLQAPCGRSHRYLRRLALKHLRGDIHVHLRLLLHAPIRALCIILHLVIFSKNLVNLRKMLRLQKIFRRLGILANFDYSVWNDWDSVWIFLRLLIIAQSVAVL